MTADAGIRALAARLRRDARITVLTGAGVSAASGIPTFRGAQGLWKHFRAEDLATPDAFASDPVLVWEWYDWRRQLVAKARPNRAHDVLAGWSRRFPGFVLVTQNVDGLHERAGTEPVVRLHGSIWELRCWNGCGRSPKSWRDDRAPLPSLPPLCPHCGGLARPGVVWFGEALDADDLDRAAAATACDVFITAGTSAIVYPAASFVYEAKRRGALTVEINPEPTPATGRLDLAIQSAAEVALDAVDRLIASGRG
jgi:NAD-dependent deacetylase